MKNIGLENPSDYVRVGRTIEHLEQGPSPFLLQGHILMAERFAGHIRVLQSKVCVH
jgi:hypothetical protein